jgi:AcrR family transcriptional regulator
MSSAADNPTTTRRRPHDAQASRQALLDAATDLFHERGYDATTIREIGERAAVDPALISRYFGCKEGLYLAVVAQPDRPPPTDDPLELVRRLLTRADRPGLGPVGLAMVSPTLSDAMRERVRDIMASRAVAPLVERMREGGVPDPELRAELLVAVAVGISLTRASGTLEALHDAAIDDVLALLGPVVDALGRS